MEGEPEANTDRVANLDILSSYQSKETNQVKLDTIEKKAVHLRLILEKDFKAADIKWSLFVTAAFSFRYESCLKPFPPAFVKNGQKDMDLLLSVITDVPALDLVLQQLDNLDDLAKISDLIDLLFYVLVRLKEPHLKTILPEAHESILPRDGSKATPKPQCIFQVVNSSNSSSEMKWKELSQNHRVFYAFHGNRLENFYTIMHFGLQNNLSKNNGVFLSPELNLSLQHSHGGFGWGASCIGGHLSCVAMCEVIDAPDGINYQSSVTSEGDRTLEDERTELLMEQTSSSSSQYVVTNCDLVRVRYLLVYPKQPAAMRFPVANNVNRNGGIRRWFSRHKLLSVLFGYGLMLATIGFAHNQPIDYYCKMLLKNLDIAYNNIKA